MNTTSGLNLGGSLKVCSFTQNLDMFDAFTGTDLNVDVQAVKWPQRNTWRSSSDHVAILSRFDASAYASFF